MLSVCVLFAQQLSMIGVVDTRLVYTTYFRESAAIRNYDAKKAEFQAEVDKLYVELQELQLQKLEYQKNNNATATLRVESQITQKSEFITEYTWAKNIELENLLKNLESSNDFYKTLYKVLSNIAEAEGYTIILSLQQDAVLWYKSDVDITNKVIAALGSR